MRFSIIIPVYNVAPYLRECLDSVSAAVAALNDDVSSKNDEVRGNEPLVEIICVDDGSTDGSGEMLDEYKEEVEKVGGGGQRTRKFVVIHQKNAGVSAARNAGLDVASGEWVMFVDADDLIHPEALTALVRTVREEGTDCASLVGFGLHEFSDNPCWGYQRGSSCRYDLANEIPSELASFSIVQFTYPRELIKGLRFRPYLVGEDLLFTAQVFCRATSCVMLGFDGYAYRRRAGSAIRSAVTARRMRDQIGYHRDMFVALAQSQKRIGAAFTRGRGNSWIESIPAEIWSHQHEDGWKMLLNEWMQSLEQAKTMVVFSRWQRCAINTVTWLKLKPLIWLLCVFPYRLKRMGLHR